MRSHLIVLFAILLSPFFLFSQTLLEVDLSGNLDCNEIVVGETVSFQMSNLCGADVQIHYEGGVVAVITEETFEYTFDLPGEYIIFCFAPPANEATQSRTAITAACYRVVDQVVPTLEQWGVINLSLLMMIFGVVFIYSEDESVFVQDTHVKA